MTSSVKLKEAFEVDSKHTAFYTGGNIQWIDDTFYCQGESNVNVLNIESGLVILSIGEVAASEESDFIQTFTTDGVKIVSSHKSGLLKLWNQNGELEKVWKYIHKGPLAKLTLKSTLLASGGSDSQVRIWDLHHQACLLSLKGCQGVVNVVEYHPSDKGLFASADDGKINYYELEKGGLQVIYDAHYSKVTSIVFSHDNKHFISCGRDKVIILWEIGKNVALKTIAVYEAIEVIVSLPLKFKLPGFTSNPDSIYVASGGENGIVRVWDVKNSKEVFTQTDSLVSKSTEGGLSITNMIYSQKNKSLAVVTVEHNIIIHHLKSFVCLEQFIGFSDEILDIAILGLNDSHIAVATNSKYIKLYDNTTMSCQILKGHEDIVLALSTSKANRNLLISAGKDNSVRLWYLDGRKARCVGVGKGHTNSIGALAFFQNSPRYFVTASQDTCVKLWEVPEKLVAQLGSSENKIKPENKIVDEKLMLSCKHTIVAHQKEINCVDISPNDKFVATASQDKTIKLWNDKFEYLGIFKGHKRGVWSVRFSPEDQVILSSSADCTIKLWSVKDFSCLKTFEGHESSVITADFLSKGMQILSAGADGLIKLFNIKNSECQCTLDQHEGKIWCLAVKSDESGFITGGSDSFLIKWKDITEDLKQQRQKEMEEQAQEEQKLSNYIKSDKLLKALKLALKLNMPLKTLNILQGIIKKGDTGLVDTVKSLRNDQKESLMKYAVEWNTNSRSCHEAQLVLNILFNELHTGEFRPVGLNKILEDALPYTERHLKRLSEMMQDIHLLNYTISCIKPHNRVIDVNIE